MTVRNLCLATVASFTLTFGAALAAGPNGPQESTPAEKAQTQQLNNAQQQQHAVDQQRYERDLAAAEADRDRYEHEMARYEWRKHHPYSWWRHRYESASLTSFYALSRPELIDVAVTDRTGFLIGHITD